MNKSKLKAFIFKKLSASNNFYICGFSNETLIPCSCKNQQIGANIFRGTQKKLVSQNQTIQRIHNFNPNQNPNVLSESATLKLFPQFKINAGQRYQNKRIILCTSTNHVIFYQKNMELKHFAVAMRQIK